MVPTIIVAGLIVLWFLRTLYLKFQSPYEGRHHLGRVQEVPPTYHPSESAWVPVPVKNREWWNARMARLRHVKYLFMPLQDLWDRKEDQYRQLIEWYGQNYRWMELPLELWPDTWKLPESIDLSRCAAGSDVPPRALAVVESLKPFKNTIRMRLAA